VKMSSQRSRYGQRCLTSGSEGQGKQRAKLTQRSIENERHEKAIEEQTLEKVSVELCHNKGQRCNGQAVDSRSRVYRGLSINEGDRRMQQMEWLAGQKSKVGCTKNKCSVAVLTVQTGFLG